MPASAAGVHHACGGEQPDGTRTDDPHALVAREAGDPQSVQGHRQGLDQASVLDRHPGRQGHHVTLGNLEVFAHPPPSAASPSAWLSAQLHRL